MTTDIVVRQMRAMREAWLELQPEDEGKPALRVKVRRPTAWEASRDFVGSRDPIENVRDYVVDWDGFSEATLLGDAIGSSDSMPFDRECWAEVVSDREDWIVAVLGALVQAVKDHQSKNAERTSG